jgi:hypothetical protein
VSSALAVSQSVARFDLPTALRADKLALMAAFMGMAIYVSPDGRWQNAPPPDQLDWDSTGLRRRFHGSLLKDQKAFGGGIRLPHHKRVEFEWRGVGQTAGVAFWNRQGRLWAASLVLCGLEDERDMAALVPRWPTVSCRSPRTRGRFSGARRGAPCWRPFTTTSVA